MRNPIPSGMKQTPKANRSGRTVLAVRIGCQAGNFCCLNLVSKNEEEQKHQMIQVAK